MQCRRKIENMRGEGRGSSNSLAFKGENCDSIFAKLGALCFEWGFTRTFPGNQDVAVK